MKYFLHYAIAFLFLLSTPLIWAQTSVHQEHMLLHRGKFTEVEWNKKMGLQTSDVKYTNNGKKRLKKEVFGWHPYWMGTAYNNYDLSLLSEISYFSYEVDHNTGSYKEIYNWKTTPLVEMAKAAGVHISLSVTLFDNHSAILTVPERQQTLIDSLVSLVKYRNADGVNIDFEMVPGGLRNQMTTFMIQLSNRFHAEIPGSRVSIAIPAVDWNNSFDVVAMTPYVDLFIIMGYEYYWSGSKNAGPVAPRNGGAVWGNYNVTKSAIDYLLKGVPAEKLLMGLPYYGRRWKTVSDALYAQTTETGKSMTYAQILAELPNVTRKWDENASNPYFVKNDAGVYTQYWYDDAQSLERKYDMINTLGLGGVGIWALGYDGSSKELWNALQNKFTLQHATNQNLLFDDVAGTKEKYHHRTNFNYMVSSQLGNMHLIVDSLAVEEDFDTLEISTFTPSGSRILRTYTGIYGKDSISSDWNNLGFRFTSDNAKNDYGWVAHLKQKVSAGYDVTPYFSDFQDNTIKMSLYRTFPDDDTLYTYYIPGKLYHDAYATLRTEAPFYSDFTKNSEGWNRAGTGISFSENGLQISNFEPNSLQRSLKKINDSYLLTIKCNVLESNAASYLRFAINDLPMSASPIAQRLVVEITPESKLFRIYRENDAQNPLYSHMLDNLSKIEIFISFAPGSEKGLLWLNDMPASEFTGKFSSEDDYELNIETMNAKCNIAEMALWKRATEIKDLPISGNSSVLPAFGNITEADTAVFLFQSLAKANLFKIKQLEFFVIDTLAPASPAWVNDINASDADTLPTVHQVTVFWDQAANGPDTEYWVGIGTTASEPNLIPYVKADNKGSFTFMATLFQENVLYRAFVKAGDASGNFSETKVSDGFYALIPTALPKNMITDKNLVYVYPNPVKQQLTIKSELELNEDIDFSIFDIQGHVVFSGTKYFSDETSIPVEHLPAGNYFVEIQNQSIIWKGSFVKQ